jgi:hypothetical protein
MRNGGKKVKLKGDEQVVEELRYPDSRHPTKNLQKSIGNKE